ncbi:hypothetical protein [Alloactinosynnema sp. L-07]|nr:hypothetical protein [Alloactinosynnema sp. L-07]
MYHGHGWKGAHSARATGPGVASAFRMRDQRVFVMRRGSRRARAGRVG